MKLHNIKGYDELLTFWRFKVREALPTQRKVVYWVNSTKGPIGGPNDVLQYRGLMANATDAMNYHQGKFILSPTDVLDLTTGLGNLWLNLTDTLKSNPWKKIYNSLGDLIEKVDHTRVLGAELLLWGEQSNDETL